MAWSAVVAGGSVPAAAGGAGVAVLRGASWWWSREPGVGEEDAAGRGDVAGYPRGSLEPARYHPPAALRWGHLCPIRGGVC